MSKACEARRDDEQSLHYAPRDFVLTGMPYKRQSGLKFERRNGHFRFQIVGHPDYGLPFGADRLIPFWLASAFRAQGCPEHRTIVFRATRDILDCYGMTPSGNQYRRLAQRIQRVFGAVYYAHDDTPGSSLPSKQRGALRRQRLQFDAGALIRAQKYSLIDHLSLWINQHSQPNQYTLWRNLIRLTEEFAEDIRNHAVPIDLDSIRAFRTRPFALDLYVWQSWRSWRLYTEQRSAVRVPVHGANGLRAQIGSQYKSDRRFMQQLKTAQEAICAIWRDCPNTVEGDRFVVRAGMPIRNQRPLTIPGVSHPPQSVDVRLPSRLSGQLVLKQS